MASAADALRLAVPARTQEDEVSMASAADALRQGGERAPPGTIVSMASAADALRLLPDLSRSIFISLNGLCGRCAAAFLLAVPVGKAPVSMASAADALRH